MPRAQHYPNEIIIHCDGKKLNSVGWKNITKKAASTIRNLYVRRKNGLKITMRQVVGLDQIDWDKVDKREEGLSTRDKACKAFFSKRLVGS